MEKRTNSEDDGSLSEESAPMRFSVLVGARRLGQEDEEVQEEQAGDDSQVDEEIVWLKQIGGLKVNKKTSACPTSKLV